MVYTKGYLTATLRVLFGGRIAEQMFFNEISSGAAMDIKQATDIARNMVREWGMGETVGMVFYGEDPMRAGMFDLGVREYSEKTAESIDVETKKILDEAYHAANRIITENRDKLDTLAKALLKFETLGGEEVNAILRGESLDRAGVADLLDGISEPPVGVARPVRAQPGIRPETGGPLPQPG
jgi:cell division protease FtsH